MKVLSVQVDTETGKVERNYERAFVMLEAGLKLYEPDVVLFPEGFASYLASTDMTAFAEDVPGATTERFCRYSKDHDVMIAFGLIRRDPKGRGMYNTIVLIDRGQIIGLYDKTHLTVDHRPGLSELKNESRMFLPGEKLGLFDTRFGRLGILICHDGEYPEVWRCLALEGARAIFWLMNCGDASATARSQARWNAIPVFTCNKVYRHEDGDRRNGCSIHVDAAGETLDLAGAAESFVYSDVDLDKQMQYRRDGVTSLANAFVIRRPELYGAIVRPTTSRDPSA